MHYNYGLLKEIKSTLGGGNGEMYLFLNEEPYSLMASKRHWR
jgi:hypothetical protein